MTHTELVERGDKWLKQQYCKVVVNENCRVYTQNREQPDVIGWRDGLSILIECKATRKDFHSDKRKLSRQKPELGMGDWRFYLSPPKVIMPEDLPEGWGLLWAYDKIVKRVHGIPSNGKWHLDKPFEGNKICENQILVSALRRLSIRGHFDEIYAGVPDQLQQTAKGSNYASTITVERRIGNTV